ncbi:peptidylprolyl isomerase [Teredinibacter sp. KSP-S5-2]|uniref:FKBP-type peptidyl-prolyl cis-trans isomerase n=1 Tax=Teredinibacter sp. KSP-S5-2 TaxID=3034506 RepID=UPI0029352077|nr:peptidylprolyl isomerase [Teredinibacter sp. KSP-S5-2]WNO09858.1 peptidylprolyl isomerase [Teredinibacter sp. KSP-S5-2]
MCVIDSHTQVVLHFSLSMEDGSVIDSNFDAEPATFTVGDGNLLPGFERSLMGLRSGDERSIKVSPADGFGMPNPNNVQVLKKSLFDESLTLEPGLVVSFADAAGAERPGMVQSFDDNEVVIDFNHPLAGKTIVFDVKIIDVQPVVKN